MPEPVRILLVEDHAFTRDGLRATLNLEVDLRVVAEARSGEEALEVLAQHPVDLAGVDIGLPGMDGIEATARIVADDLAKVLILTTFDRDDYLFDALRAGAGGFLLKNSDPDDLVAAVRAVGHGHALLAPEVTRRVIEQMITPATQGTEPALASPAAAPGLSLLTTREVEVLTLVARGLSNAEIAGELTVSDTTIKSHVSSCLAKLHLRDRVQAVVFAYEVCLIRPGD